METLVIILLVVGIIQLMVLGVVSVKYTTLLVRVERLERFTDELPGQLIELVYTKYMDKTFERIEKLEERKF